MLLKAGVDLDADWDKVTPHLPENSLPRLQLYMSGDTWLTV